MKLRKKRCLRIEHLDPRWVMTNGMAIDLIPGSGQVTMEGGNKVVTVAPGSVVQMTATARTNSQTRVTGFQLNFVNSDVQAGELVLSNWTANAQNWSVPLGDFSSGLLVGGGQPSTLFVVPSPPTQLGTFQVTVPQGGGDYLLTAEGGSGGDRSVFTGLTQTDAVEIETFQDVIFRVDSHAPQAVNDTYTLTQGTTLTTTANNGVLANDTDADGDTLTAQLVNNVQHGQLTLNGNGSFTYTPITWYFGTDTFTYRASDGDETSNTATVTLTINATTPWRNPLNPLDVDANLKFIPLDILIVINRINEVGTTVGIPAPGGSFGSPPPYYDSTGDNNLFPNDVLYLINAINAGLTMPESEAPDEPQLLLSVATGGTDPHAAEGEAESIVQQEVSAIDVSPLSSQAARRYQQKASATIVDSSELEPLLDLLADEWQNTKVSHSS